MLVLRYAALLMLVVWVGGLLVLGGVVAPSIFETMAARQIAEGRLLAGAVFGAILRKFSIVSLVAGCALLLTLVVRAVLGPRPRRLAFRIALVVFMLAATAYAALIVAPRIDRLQRTIGMAPSSLRETDVRRIEFGRLHALSTGLQLVPILGGLSLIYWELKE
jgi:Domain of unknown function (DUF4149)